MSATMASALVNGFASGPSENISDSQEYEKILKLRDEIFAGTHPRLTVPQHAIRKVSPLSAANAVVPPVLSVTMAQTQLPGLSLNTGEDKNSNMARGVNNTPASAQTKPTTASGIDPVLLMKSDELVKAETQLHRQRLEKSLRDQFEQKRYDARKKPTPGEAKPDFDVLAILTKAQEIAKPEGTSTPKEDASVSDSYDEHSLYSSKAPDSTPEVGEVEDSASSQNQNPLGASFGANGPAETQARHVSNITAPVHPILHEASAYLPTTGMRKPSGMLDLTMADPDDEEEEGEYSPPEAVEQLANSGDPNLQTAVDPRMRTLRRYSELDENRKRPGSPSDNVRIVRNHILSPIAPQPSRVSPLAVAKDPLILQNPRVRNGRANHRQSPDGPGQGNHPKKKRKLEKKAEKRKRNGMGSPDIKDEPISPPPFHDVQPLGSGRMRPATDNRPIIIDDGPVRPVRYVQAGDPYLNSPIRPMSRAADPAVPLSEPRINSRSGLRPMRDDADLRRVASMHNMRVEPPREYIEQIYESPTRARAASYVRVDSPARMEPPRMIQDVPQAYEREANQGVRLARSPAPTYREVYQGPEPEVRYIPEPMPPPPIERIVVDQYGRRFREIIQDRSSVAPRSYSTYPDRGQPSYYENYDQSRGQSVMIESRQEARMPHEMAPPQVVRQTAEPGPGYREVYEPLAPPPRSGSVRPVEQASRQPLYMDERPEYRASVRVGSVRPTSVRYEEMAAPPMTARAGSVRPGVREGSVFIDDRSQVRREYMPVEAPRYRVVEPEPRYIDASGREITYVEGSQDVGPRYVQRY